jgi:hypothetical protein
LLSKQQYYQAINAAAVAVQAAALTAHVAAAVPMPALGMLHQLPTCTALLLPFLLRLALLST